MARNDEANGFSADNLTGLELAEHIEADARHRLTSGDPVDLSMYVAAVSNLEAEPTALDAAIDMALRALVQAGMSREDAARRLTDDYPQFRDAIEVAVELDHALWSTQSVSRYFNPAQPARELPCLFGTTLEDGKGRYELRELLGTGSFGQVYLARDRQLSDDEHDALVSIKVLPAGSRAGQWSRWLSDEATKARRVRHRNVVSVLDRDTTSDGDVFIVYEFVDGGDLREYAEMHGERMDPREAARIIADIAEGAHAAHMAGLVHCDLKPSNIVLTAEGEPKVADFGVARRLRATDADGPTEDRIGNPAFMSPEQYRMQLGSLTIPTDIYALGGMLYWLVTGRYPNGDTPAEIARRHESTEASKPPSIRDLLPDIDSDLDRICQRALSPAPESRHDSARALANDLRRWVNHEPIEWMHVSPLRRVSLWTKRRPVTAIMAIGGTVVVIASVIVAAGFAQSAAIKQKEIEINDQLQGEFFETINDFVGSFAKLKAAGQYDWLFRDIWFSRWLYEPGRWLEPDTLAEKVDRTQIDAVELQVKQLYQTSGPTSLRVLMWEGCLAFWYVHEERWSEALDVIATTQPKVEALNPDDPWLIHLAGLRAIALMHHESEPDLRAIESAMIAAEQDLQKSATYSPMHLLMLRSLETLYGPNFLGDADRAADIGARITEAEKADQFAAE